MTYVVQYLSNISYADIVQWLVHQLPKLRIRVRFSLSAPEKKPCNNAVTGLFALQTVSASNRFIIFSSKISSQFCGVTPIMISLSAFTVTPLSLQCPRQKATSRFIRFSSFRSRIILAKEFFTSQEPFKWHEPPIHTDKIIACLRK